MEWIKREQQIPNHGQQVWVWDGFNRHLAVFHVWDRTKVFNVIFPSGIAANVTHWMPLPDPPEDK